MYKKLKGHSCVHVMPKEKFSKGFVAFTNTAFPDSNIYFILYGPERIGYETPDANNVIFVDDFKSVSLDEANKKILRECSLIVLNWVEWRLAVKLYRYHKKTAFLFWGGDLEGALSNGAKSLSRLSKSLLVRRASSIITLIPGDLANVELLTAKHGNWYLASIYDETECIENRRFFDEWKECKPIRVLVGNSATPSNRHKEIFRLLSEYKNEEIEVLVPLSYGCESYRNEVLQSGRELLGATFRPILDYMNREQYRELLSTISVGVFNHNRQQGLGNIQLLMGNGAKIFIADDGPMWKDFAEEGRIVYPTRLIETMSFADFVEYSEDEAIVNFQFVCRSALYGKSVSEWQKIYFEYGILEEAE